MLIHQQEFNYLAKAPLACSADLLMYLGFTIYS